MLHSHTVLLTHYHINNNLAKFELATNKFIVVRPLPSRKTAKKIQDIRTIETKQKTIIAVARFNNIPHYMKYYKCKAKNLMCVDAFRTKENLATLIFFI